MSSSGNGFIVVIVLFFAGLLSIYDGMKKYLLAQKIRNAPTSSVEAAAVGLVELKGHAMCSEPMLSPVAKEKCAYWRVVGQYYQSGKHGGWKQIYKADSGTRFCLEDPTGRMLVDPAGAEIDIPHDHLYEGYISGKGVFGMQHTQMDQGAVDFVNGLDEKGKSAFMGHQHENVRVYEYYIAEGDDIYVLGNAEPIEGASSSVGYENLIVKKGQFDKTMYISDSGERKILEKFGSGAYWKIFIGLALSAVCLFIILLYLRV